MKTYLNSLNDREKWMVIGAGLCLILYVYYLFLYEPLHQKITQKSEHYIEKVDTLEWMKTINQTYHPAKSKQTLDNSKLLTLIASQLKEKETLKVPSQIQQTSAGEIQITFDEVPFTLFIHWLIQLNEQYQIIIKQFEVDRTDKPGVTHLMIILSATP